MALTVAITLITFATALKDVIEVAQSIRAALEQVRASAIKYYLV